MDDKFIEMWDWMEENCGEPVVNSEPPEGKGAFCIRWACGCEVGADFGGQDPEISFCWEHWAQFQGEGA